MLETQKELGSVHLHHRFNRDAKVFEAIYNEEEKGFSRWFNRNFRKPVYERYKIALEIIGREEGKTLIDVGCGTGIYMIAAIEQGILSALGIDLSEIMLKYTAKKIGERNLSDKCKLLQGNFLELEIKEKYNFSLAMGVFDYLADPLTFMTKLRNVSKDKVIASFPSHSLIRKPLRKLRYLATFRGTVYFYSKEDIEALAKQVGFSHYQIIPMTTGSGFVLSATP